MPGDPLVAVAGVCSGTGAGDCVTVAGSGSSDSSEAAGELKLDPVSPEISEFSEEMTQDAAENHLRIFPKERFGKQTSFSPGLLATLAGCPQVAFPVG